MAKKTYTVKTRVEHDGEPFEPGSAIDLEPKHADPLLAVGAIEAPAEPQTKSKKTDA